MVIILLLFLVFGLLFSVSGMVGDNDALSIGGFLISGGVIILGLIIAWIMIPI